MVVMPDLYTEEAAQYVALNELEIGTIPLSTSRSDDWIFSLWDSGNFFSCLNFICIFVSSLHFLLYTVGLM